ncbi:MAG: hypothetical protein HKN85_09945 [Gammaproteobacteria bacterium]|nr:hypothetical protein [Gammaproteobacteria bacterium]
MNKHGFVKEVERRLAEMYKASRNGHIASAEQRHQLEGFIQAGIFIAMVKSEEMAELMERVHLEVFGMSIEEHKHQHAISWDGNKIDYSYYDAPTYERLQNK